MNDKKFTFLFPGQGSQQPGMGRYLYDNFSVAKHCFEEASEVLRQDMAKLCFEGSDQDLAFTENTQPCLLLVSVATALAAKNEFGIQAEITAGHSIGEYAAMVISGSMKFSDAIFATRERGRAMQQAVPVGKGGMAAIMGLDPLQVQQLCEIAVQKSAVGPLSAANFNGPGQIVISGNQKTLDWIKSEFKTEMIAGFPSRWKMIPLNVSAPFHSMMMEPAEKHMRLILEGLPWKDALPAVLQNFTAQPETKMASLRENLIRQVSAPVRWLESMQWLKDHSFSVGIEMGSGKVLQSLFKKMDSDFFKVYSTTSLEDFKLLEELAKSKN
jgi:[acyl-carrier-protein] S-malonyltransferase